MKTKLLALFLGFVLSSYAQDSIPCYFDVTLAPTTKGKAVFNGKMIQTPEGIWQAFAYYPTGERILLSEYKDKKLRIKHGSYVLYFQNGQERAATTFNNNQLDGPYTSWHASGAKAEAGTYTSNTKNGVWSTWYSDGVAESEGTYNSGFIDGTWKWFHENGKPSTVEVYENNQLKDLTCFDENGTNTGFNCRIDKKPTPKNAYSFESYVIENLLYPEEALKKQIEGVVEFEFFVTKEGKLTRINFANPNSNRILQEAIVNFLKAVPEWEPAISHNRKVDCLYNYSVPFYLP